MLRGYVRRPAPAGQTGFALVGGQTTLKGTTDATDNLVSSGHDDHYVAAGQASNVLGDSTNAPASTDPQQQQQAVLSGAVSAEVSPKSSPIEFIYRLVGVQDAVDLARQINTRVRLMLTGLAQEGQQCDALSLEKVTPAGVKPSGEPKVVVSQESIDSLGSASSSSSDDFAKRLLASYTPDDIQKALEDVKNNKAVNNGKSSSRNLATAHVGRLEKIFGSIGARWRAKRQSQRCSSIVSEPVNGSTENIPSVNDVINAANEDPKPLSPVAPSDAVTSNAAPNAAAVTPSNVPANIPSNVTPNATPNAAPVAPSNIPSTTPANIPSNVIPNAVPSNEQQLLVKRKDNHMARTRIASINTLIITTERAIIVVHLSLSECHVYCCCCC